MGLFKSQKFLITVITCIALYSCNKTKIKGPSNEGTNRKPIFVVANTHSATSSSQGEASLTINSMFEMQATCENCGTLNLQFRDVPPQQNMKYAQSSKFNYPFIDKTYVCKAQITLNFIKTKSVNKYVYGIYFCPHDPSTGQRICDKQNAISRCGF
ncbi:MAG: hypothetical protein R3B45_11265 [Bdellovibrionota bacterium]